MIQSAELHFGKPSHAWEAFSFCSHSAKACRATATPPWQWIWPRGAVNPLPAMSAFFGILLASFLSQFSLRHKSAQTSKAKPSLALHHGAPHHDALPHMLQPATARHRCQVLQRDGRHVRYAEGAAPQRALLPSIV